MEDFAGKKTAILKGPVVAAEPYGPWQTFPEVEELVISEEVRLILIPNIMFPNVKKVVSYSDSFCTGRVLVDSSKTLLNTFCKKEGEEIDLKGILKISDYAFSDCKSVNIKNTESVQLCKSNAFIGSAVKNQPGSVKMAGSILAGLDYSEKTATIPGNVTLVSYGADDLSGFDCATFELKKESTKYLEQFTKFPKRVVMRGDYTFNLSDVLIHREELEYVDIEGKQRIFKSHDGIIYFSDMRTLAKCPPGRSGAVVIPEGVAAIDPMAFAMTKITEVKLPDSLKSIRNGAFSQCKYLKKIDFGHGITKIEKGNKDNRLSNDSIFRACESLKHVEIPPQVESIGNSVFAGSGLTSVKLHEGLKYVGFYAFSCVGLKYVELPESLECMEERSFAYVSRVKLGKKIPKNILNATVIKDIWGNEDLHRALKTAPYSCSNVVTFETPSGNVYIPKFIESKRLKKLNEMLNSADSWDEICNESLYEYGAFDDVVDDTALHIFLDTGREDAKEHIKKNCSRVIKNLLEEGRETDAAKVIEFGLADRACLMEVIEGECSAVIKAYAMRKMQEEGKEEMRV